MHCASCIVAYMGLSAETLVIAAGYPRLSEVRKKSSDWLFIGKYCCDFGWFFVKGHPASASFICFPLYWDAVLAIGHCL